MERSPGSGRRRLEWLLVSGLVAAVVATAALYGWLGRLDAALYDLALTWRGRPAAADIVIIGIDDKSLARIGRWPWPRNLHAALLDRLTAAGVAAVASDLILTEDDGGNRGSDRALAQAIAANGRVILPVLHEVHRSQGLVEVLPIAPLAAAAAGFGHIRRHTDGDGIVRRAELWVRVAGVSRPHLALAMLGLVDPERYLGIAATDGTPNLIPYAGPPGHYHYYSYSDVLFGKVPADALRGKVIFIGATATGLSDNFPTPVSGSHVDMPGIEICATLFDALRSGEHIEEVQPAAAALAAVASVVLLLVALRISSPLVGLMLSVGHVFLWLAGSLVLLIFAGTWLPPAAALAGSVLAYPLWSWRRLAAAQAYMEREIDELRREPGMSGMAALPAEMAADPFVRSIDDIRGAIGRLRAARRFVQDVIDGMPVGILVSDSRLIVRLANSRLEELLGTLGRHPVGADAVEVLAGLRWPPGGDLCGRLAAGQTLQLEAETAIGRYVLLNVEPFGAGLLFTLADITDLRQAQEARDMALRFLSHDLRAPLASILTLLQEPAGADVGSRIAAHAGAALQMADDFTQLARAEALDERAFTEIDLVVAIEDAIDDAWVRAREKDIDIIRDFAEEEATVMGDRSVLRRAIFNLLDNAIRYSPPATSVTVRLARAGTDWALGISDRGYGIAAEDLPRLFTPYVRLSLPGQPATPGTGLGLPMVKAAAERHGGRAEVRSEPGAGSCFTVYLPALANS